MPSTSLPALPLGLVVWLLERVLVVDPEDSLEEVTAGNLCSVQRKFGLSQGLEKTEEWPGKH